MYFNLIIVMLNHKARYYACSDVTSPSSNWLVIPLNHMSSSLEVLQSSEPVTDKWQCILLKTLHFGQCAGAVEPNSVLSVIACIFGCFHFGSAFVNILLF